MKTALLLVSLLIGLATVPATASAPTEAVTAATTSETLTPQELQELVDQLVWTAGSLQRILAEQDYPSLLMLSALNRVFPQEGEGALEGLGPLLAELALGSTGAAGAPSTLQRCRAQASPVEGALCSLESLIPLAPPSLGRELAEEGARLVALYTRPGDGPPGSTLASTFGLDPVMTGTLGGALASAFSGGGGSRLDPLQRFAEEALEGAWRLRAAAALTDARDALLTDQTTPVDDLSLTAALADTSVENLSRRITYLGRVAQERFGHFGMKGGRGLANPLEWAVASQIYLAMLQDWPEHARGVASGDLEVMRFTGREIRDALVSVTVDPATGRPGTLLRDVLAYYQRQVASLTEEADVLARRHQQAHLRRIPADAVLDRLEPLQQGIPSLAIPPHIAGSVPQEVRTAAVLALGDASLVYRLAAEDSVSRENFRRHLRIFGRRHDRLTFTRTQVEVELRFGHHGTLATYQSKGPFVLQRTEEMAGGEGSEDVRSATIRVPDSWSHFLAELWPQLAADPGLWEASTPTAFVLRTLEGAIEAELRRYASAALDDVFTTVCQSDPESSGLASEDRQSALRIRSAMGSLTAARTLLQSYLRLALPLSVEQDTALRETLWGPGAVLDRDGLCQAFAAGENPLRMVWLEEEPRQRAATLAEALDAALAWEGGIAQHLPLLDDTLEHIEAAVRIQRIRMAVALGGS